MMSLGGQGGSEALIRINFMLGAFSLITASAVTKKSASESILNVILQGSS